MPEFERDIRRIFRDFITPTYDIELNRDRMAATVESTPGFKNIVYWDGPICIEEFTRETYHHDDYDTFTRYQVFYNSDLVYEEDDGVVKPVHSSPRRPSIFDPHGSKL
jgi:hypothetical protein